MVTTDARGATSLDRLVEEATRQLNICNACRYCEGYCAVFPALERRNLLAEADVIQLSNLCHDCRACYDACMYTPPHEFALNLPKALSMVRLDTYDRYLWPRRLPRLLSGWLGVVVGSVLASVIVLAIALIHAGPDGLVAHSGGAWSPYEVTPFPALLAMVLVPAAYAVLVMVRAGVLYWRDTGLTARYPRRQWRAVASAIGQSLTLRNLRGGGEGCYYPESDQPSPARRWLHGLVAFGFLLCAISTTSAATLEHLLDSAPPYPYLSVPVGTGAVGGAGIVVGCIGLLLLKRRASAVISVAAMSIKDYGLLWALSFLAASGLATLLLRETAAFGIAYLIHLASIAVTFAAAPYSKFPHFVYRFLALVRDNLEKERA